MIIFNTDKDIKDHYINNLKCLLGNKVYNEIWVDIQDHLESKELINFMRDKYSKKLYGVLELKEFIRTKKEI